MLKPLGTTNNRVLEITRTCESCGRVFPSDKSINHMISVRHVIGSPGHADLPPMQCEQEEHWACSIECWTKVAHACIDEHMVQLIKNAHDSLAK